MAVAFDAVGPSAAGQTATGVATTSWSHTCSGSDRLLIVGAAIGDNATPTITGVTYNSVAMTSVATVLSNNTVGAGFIQMFRLIAPAAGANTVQVTTSAAVNAISAGSTSFTGAHQTTPLGTPATAFGTGAPTVNVTGTTAGNMVVDAVCNGLAITSSSQTSRWLRNTNTNTGAGNGASSTATAGGSVTMAYTVSSDWYGIVAAEVQASAAGVALPILQPYTARRRAANW